MKVLYCSLVRSLLEYGTVLRNPNQSGLILKLDKLQKNFLRFYAYKTNYPYHSTDEIANFVRLKSLKTRRLVFDATFMHKILNGVIICPELLQKIGLKVPSLTQELTHFLLYLILKIITLQIVRCVAYLHHVI